MLPLILSSLFLVIDSSSSYACQTLYSAKQGDSWWLIANKHGITLDRVLKLNKAKPSTQILVGESVCVTGRSGRKKKQLANYSSVEVIQIIREEWPDELEERAIQIARRESRLNPQAVGVPNRCCYGLFQIYYRWHKGWLSEVGIEQVEQLLDPRLNARAAFRIYQRNSGWGPWG